MESKHAAGRMNQPTILSRKNQMIIESVPNSSRGSSNSSSSSQHLSREIPEVFGELPELLGSSLELPRGAPRAPVSSQSSLGSSAPRAQPPRVTSCCCCLLLLLFGMLSIIRFLRESCVGWFIRPVACLLSLCLLRSNDQPLLTGICSEAFALGVSKVSS